MIHQLARRSNHIATSTLIAIAITTPALFAQATAAAAAPKPSDSMLTRWVIDGGPTMRIFLMPAGPGCIQIKKEVMF